MSRSPRRKAIKAWRYAKKRGIPIHTRLGSVEVTDWIAEVTAEPGTVIGSWSTPWGPVTHIVADRVYRVTPEGDLQPE